MGKQLIVNCDAREIRIGMLEDGKLVDLYFQRSVDQRLVGNIYKGRVHDILPGMQAAFVDIGLEKNAFLYVDDVVTDTVENVSKIKKDIPISSLLHQGQELLVQVIKEPFGTKGARVSTNINIPGRYSVLMPLSDYIGISRKVEEEADRTRLRTWATSLCERDQHGIILRTVAGNADYQQIQADYEQLSGVWRAIRKRAEAVKTPSVVHQDLEIVPRILRDILNDEIAEIVVDRFDEYLAVSKMVEQSEGQSKPEVTHYHRNVPIFDYFEIESEIEQALRPKVWLRNGGYLIFDTTEALTVVDVNTGKYVGKRNLEETVVNTNIEAAKEIALQLRLRNISGIIIVDFIDMHIDENQKRVLQILEQELKKDRNKTQLLGITKLGLVEITRKKIRKSLHEVFYEGCTCCGGRGKVLSDITIANKIDREVRFYLRHTKDEAIVVEMHADVQEVFSGIDGEHIQEIKTMFGKQILIRSCAQVDRQHFRIVFSGDEREAKEYYG